MSYLGNSRSLLTWASSVRDDIIPDGLTNRFLLSQEVPGGNPESVLVMRRRFISNRRIFTNTYTVIATINSETIEGGRYKYNITLNVNDSGASSTLYTEISSRLTTDDKVYLSYIPSDDTTYYRYVINNLDISTISYSGSSISIVGIAYSTTKVLASETALQANINLSYTNYWEILEPDVDYTITGDINSNQYNRILELSDIPIISDAIYVIHRGASTYNLVPAFESVGPEQLQKNLREFSCDRCTGDGTTKIFPANTVLKNGYISPESLIVTVDNEVIDCDYIVNGTVVQGGWKPNQESLSEQQYFRIEFHNAPENNANIRILNLGFSTNARRAAYTPGQPQTVIEDSSITGNKIAPLTITTTKIADGAITSAKIADNSITYNDISSVLLKNIKALSTVTEEENTMMYDNTALLSVKPSTGAIAIKGTTIIPDVNNVTSLGSSTYKFKELYANDVHCGDKLYIGSTSLNVNDLDNNIKHAPGMIEMYAGTSTNIPSGWLLCDGSEISNDNYPALYAVLNGKYGSRRDSATNILYYNLPNLIEKFPLGANESSSDTTKNLGGIGGSSTHTHSTLPHYHVNRHTHNVLPHYHTIDVSIGSNINILKSGSHITYIDHQHGINDTEASHVHEISDSLSIDDTVIQPQFKFVTQTSDNQNISTVLQSANSVSSTTITHNIDSTCSDDGEHLHGLNVSAQAVYNTDATATEKATEVFVVSKKYTETPHSVSISNTMQKSVKHSHSISSTEPNQFLGLTAHTHNHNASGISGTGSSSLGNGHKHVLGNTLIPNTEARYPSGYNNGVHTHATTDFSGSIGNVNSGNSGDILILTSENTPYNTESAEVVLNSATTLPPYVTVNYIIKY